jgi:hypothetical protein
VNERRYEFGTVRNKMLSEHLPMGEAPVPRKNRTCTIKRASKRDNLWRPVWMMAVKRRPKPARPAFLYSEFKSSSVFGVRGIIGRSSIVK